MYPNLIPRFIADRFLNCRNLNKLYKEGKIFAGVLFVDISGFTKTTEQLMANGKEGAEVLSNLINEIFSPGIEIIYKNGGFITHFAGDAFCAVFPKDKNLVRRIFSSALEIANYFKDQGRYKTKFGSFSFSVKIGISFGKVIWGIIFNKHQNGYYFRGDPLYQAAECEKYCQGNDIIFDHTIKSLLAKEKISLTRKNNFKFQLKNITPLFNGRKKIRPIIYQRKLRFYPNTVFNLSQSGDFRNVAVCFISFPNKTDIQISLSKIIDLVHQYDGYFNNINYGDKGSFLLAFFGAPFTREKIFRNAVDFVVEINKIKMFQGSTGITYGMVYSGFRGSKYRAEYICLGSVVNLSARLMKKAKAGQILTNESLFRLINTEYRVNYIGGKKLKGFRNLQPVYEIIEKKKGIVRPKYQTNLVGREKEFKKLLQNVENSIGSPKKQLTYVYGEPGIGKSRLLYELKNNLPEKISIIEFHTDSILKKNFNCLLTTFNKLINHQGMIPQNFSLDKLKKNYLKFIKSYDLKEDIEKLNYNVNEFFDVIAYLFGFSDKKSFLSNLPPQDFQKQLIELVYLFLKILIGKNKYLLLIEDLHWMDLNSKEVFNRLILDSEISSPFIITSRYTGKNEKPAFDYVKGIEKIEIELEGISLENEKIIIEKLLNDKVSESLYNNIHQKVQGNPFFVEQYCNFLIESDLLKKSAGSLKLNNKQIDIPSNVNDMIMSRVDRLPDELKQVIFISSVIGSEVDIDLLIRIIKKLKVKFDRGKINKTISMGVDKNIWDKKSLKVLIFHHILIKEVAYEMQARNKLRKYHETVGEVLEETYTNQPGFYSNLAYHYQKAEIEKKAVDYLEKAGDWNKKSYDNKSAIDHYQQLLNYNLPKEKIINIKKNQAEIHTVTGDYKSAYKYYAENLNLAKIIRNSLLLADSFLGIGIYYYNISEYYQAINYFRKAKELYKKENNNKGLCWVYLYVGIVLTNRGKYKIATSFFNKILLLSKLITDDELKHLALWNLATVKSRQGLFPQALKLYQKQLTIFKKTNDLRRINIIKNQIAYMYSQTGEYKKALGLFESVIKFYKKINYRQELAIAYGNLGIVYYYMGDYQKALNYFQQKFITSSDLDDKHKICNALGNMGIAYSKLGELDKAMELYQQQLIIAKKIGASRELEGVLCNIGLIYSKKGEIKKAINYYNRFLNISLKFNRKNSISNAYSNLGHLYYLIGNNLRALEYLEKAISYAEKAKIKFFLCRQLIIKARVLIELKKFSEAEEDNHKGTLIADEINRRDALFQGKLNQALIQYNRNSKEALSFLKALLQKNINQREKADTLYTLFQLTNKDGYRKESLSLYKVLLKTNPDYQIIRNIERLEQKD